MIFQREKCQPIIMPSPTRIGTELGRIGGRRSSFASITRDDGSYLQVAGYQSACRLEFRDNCARRQYCGFQNPPKLPFADGTTFTFSRNECAMKQDEWFQMDQVIEAFTAFSLMKPLPSYIQWRDITEVLAEQRIARD